VKHRAGLEQFEVEGIDDDETFEVAAAASVQQARGNAMMIDDPVSLGGAPVSKARARDSCQNTTTTIDTFVLTAEFGTIY